MNSSEKLIHLNVVEEHALVSIVALIQFTIVLDFLVIMPLGPRIIDSLGIETSSLGTLNAVRAIGSVVSGLLSSIFFSQFSPKKYILLLYSGFLLSIGGGLMSPSVTSLIVSRLCVGIFSGALLGSTLALIATALPLERRVVAMSRISIGSSSSVILGIPLCLFISSYFQAWKAAFLFLVIFGLLNLIFALFKFPIFSSEHKAASPDKWSAMVGHILKTKSCLEGFGIILFQTFSTYLVLPFLSVYLVKGAGATEKTISTIYMLSGLGLIGLSIGIGKAIKKVDLRTGFTFLAILSLVPACGLFSPDLGLLPLSAAATLFLILQQGKQVLAQAICTEATSGNIRSVYLNVLMSVQSIAIGLATALGGFLIKRSSSPEGKDISVIIASSLVFSILCLLQTRRRAKLD